MIGLLSCPKEQKLEQRGRKNIISRLRQQWAADGCSPVWSTPLHRCLVVNGLYLKLLVVSKKFYASCFGSEPGLGRGVFYSFLHHLGPWASRHTTFLGYTAAIAVWFRKIFWKGEAPLAHWESETCLLLLADPRTHVGHNPGWCCIIRFHWVRS